MRNIALLLYIFGFALLIAGCGAKAPVNGINRDAEAQYGKPGPGASEACYNGAAAAKHSCAEALSSDSAGIQSLDKYCTAAKGLRLKKPCSNFDLVGTCRYMPAIPALKMRFYKQTWDEAKYTCDQIQGKLDRFF